MMHGQPIIKIIYKLFGVVFNGFREL